MKNLLVIFLLTTGINCHAQTAQVMPSTAMSATQDSASIFMPGLISDGGVFGLTLSPDGEHALWVRSGGRRSGLVVMESHRLNGIWQTPTVAPFSGGEGYNDIDPAFSPDGKTLIFQSNRAVPGQPQRKGFDIYSVKWNSKAWGPVVHLGNLINTDASESSATMAANGSIYFMKENPDGVSRSDLYVSRLADGVYQTPINLGSPVNTRERESNPFIAPDESYLIYFSSAPGGLGDVDLMISFNEQGGWSAPRNLGAPINSVAAEFCPFVQGGRLYLSRQTKDGDRFIENIHSFPFDAAAYRTPTKSKANH